VSFPIALHPVLDPGDSEWVLALLPNRTEASFRSDFGGVARRLSPAAPEGPELRRQLLIAAAPLPRNSKHTSPFGRGQTCQFTSGVKWKAASQALAAEEKKTGRT
jgi:hypothetical protein